MGTLILLIEITLFGVLVSYFFKLKLFLEARVVVGLLIGLVWLGYLMFGLSLWIGLNWINLLVFEGITFLLSILLFSKKILLENTLELKELSLRVKEKSWIAFWTCLLLLCAFLGYLASNLLTSAEGHLFVSPLHAYGDISLHLSIINSFSFGANFPPQSPILAGTPISYPFMIDFLTAIFVNPLGLSINSAVTLVGVLLMVCLVIVSTYFVLRVTGSKLAAVMTLLLFVFNGGLGFLLFFDDLRSSNQTALVFLTHLSKDYTALKDLGFWWINIVLAMLLPQRSFLFGFPVAVLLLHIFWDLSENFNRRLFILGVILVTLLPLIHTHTLIAISVFLIWLTILFLKKNNSLLAEVLIIGGIGGMLTIFISSLFLQQTHSLSKMLTFHPGWTNIGEDPFIFYFKNFGLMLVVLPVFLVIGLKRKLKIAVFALIAQLWFILPSIFTFQPWDFDNIKLFVYWYFGSTILAGFYISRLVLSRVLGGILLGIMLLISIIFTGVIDNIRLLSGHGTKYEIYSPQAIKVAEFVKSNTPPDAVFLSVDKFDNPAVALAGRKTILGFKVWAWSYGLDFSERDQDVINMLSGQGEGLLQKYQVSYAIFFNQPTDYPVHDEYFKSKFEIVYNQDGYQIYEIK